MVIVSSVMMKIGSEERDGHLGQVEVDADANKKLINIYIFNTIVIDFKN
jgi:hypothetical protein